MAKTCPSCGYNPIGPFTDNCPICAEPVRNVRSGGGGGYAPGRPAPPAVWMRWVIGAAVVGVLSVGGCCGFGLWRAGLAIKDAQKMVDEQRAKAEADRRARTVAVPAAQLLQEFQDDAGAAERKYRGKCLEISGVVERSGRDENEIPFVVLHAGDEQAKLKVECFFVFANEAGDPRDVRVEQLNKGQTVTVRGEYGGRISNVRVRDCVLVK